MTRFRLLLLGLAVLLALSCALSLVFGAAQVPLERVLAILARQLFGIEPAVAVSVGQDSIVWQLRAPRVLLGALVLHRLEHGRDEISRSLPDWLRRGLKYAPLAALAAVIAPELVMSQGALIKTLADARLPAVLCASAYYFWRRGILGTIVVGMAVYLPLHIGLGW